MHLSKLFLVSVWVYIGVANASILEKRKSCGLQGGPATCLDDKGGCLGWASCHNHWFWWTCRCSTGYVTCDTC